ncbi:hypothetical protein [Streptomyces oceani]|uniref:Uncharacterized protein n=1 Tax=Streptomyces oceani TaxID=1075402 RepID=A0A1E7KHW6_9ACTN|nr:hypothetical protein [Streptomyces oceani]OEV03510.1 hypothetical protein AN216_11690 [Streptomyces oceani]
MEYYVVTALIFGSYLLAAIIQVMARDRREAARQGSFARATQTHTPGASGSGGRGDDGGGGPGGGPDDDGADDGRSDPGGGQAATPDTASGPAAPARLRTVIPAPGGAARTAEPEPESAGTRRADNASAGITVGG